ncbi:hypothetical protein IH781_03305 [Patescibacteria group bacterium]|nr:hypothetical protein [Patescibacteria group bacterium]
MRTVQLRQQYGWSKHKLTPLLKQAGYEVSVSTVGRVIKRRGLINPKASRKRQRAATHPKRRHLERPEDSLSW